MTTNIDTDATLLTLQAILKQEQTCYIAHNFFESLLPYESSSACGAPVDAVARRQIAQWCYSIMEACHYSRETTAITMSCLDRFVATQDGHAALLDRSQYQLAALAAVYTTVKIHCAQALSPDLVSRLSQGSYSREDIENMERKILNAVQWRVNPPTAMDFVRTFLELIPTDSLDEKTKTVIVELAALQVELSIIENQFLTAKASHIAAASLLNSIESICHDDTELFQDLAELICVATKADTDNLEKLRGLLYEGIMDETSDELVSTQKAASHIPMNKRMHRDSFAESPRSVYEHSHAMV